MGNKGKKIIFGITVVIFLGMIILLFNENKDLKQTNSTLKIEKQILVDNTDTFEYLNSITVDSFEKRIAEGDDLFVYIGNSECSDCSVFSKELKREVESFPLKDSLYLVEISSIHSDKERWLDFKRRYGFDQTPAFLLFQNGKVKSMIEWTEKNGLNPETFHNWLEGNRGFIQQLDN